MEYKTLYPIVMCIIYAILYGCLAYRLAFNEKDGWAAFFMFASVGCGVLGGYLWGAA